jgi:SEC-C motif-containing protein
MRSRFAAFALGLGEYLVETLAEEHPDREHPREELVRSLTRARERQRFLDLRILETCTEGDHGEVLFHARVFERGEDRSFAELSSFQREGAAWRYATGVLVSAAHLPGDVGTLDKRTFLALAHERRERP